MFEVLSILKAGLLSSRNSDEEPLTECSSRKRTCKRAGDGLFWLQLDGTGRTTGWILSSYHVCASLRSGWLDVFERSGREGQWGLQLAFYERRY